MKTVQLDKFDGMRNDVSPERFTPKDLTVATNIELDETGKPTRRLGTTNLDATPMHSLWANDEMCLCVRGGTLQRMFADYSFHDYGIQINGVRVAYERVGNDVYFSDGEVTGIISSTDGYRMWGIPVPPPPSPAPIIGDMRAGTYLVTTTYVRGDGKESGASPVIRVHVDTNGGVGLLLTPSIDPLVTSIRVYISDWNGEVPYLLATLDASDPLCQIASLPAERTLAVRTLRMGPPPAGQLIKHYKGRLYVGQNNYLWYSQPHEYELVDRAVNYLGFTSPVRTFASVSDGLYVGTDDDTSYLRGNGPEEFTREVVAPYGTVLGTEIEVPSYYFEEGKLPEPASLWMSVEGLCAGFPQGQYKNLTGERYSLPDGVATGASLLKIRGKSPQLVTTLFS